MRIRSSSFYLRWASLVFILFAVILAVVQLVRYSLSRSEYPRAMTIAGVPVGKLDPQSAAQRVFEIYSLPVVLHYSDAVILLDPTTVGFQINIESMLAAADLQRTDASFWGGYWDYLWNRGFQTADIPLVATYSEDRLRAYLSGEISARYDELPAPAQPVPGTTEFSIGSPGLVLDVNRAVSLIKSTLWSPNKREVILTSMATTSGRPSMDILQTMLQQIIDKNGFEGIVDLYIQDLQSGVVLHFAYTNGEFLPVEPDIAFTAVSTMKIPIMVSVYHYQNGSLDDRTSELMLEMFKQSDNNSSDALMRKIDEGRGPLVVTEDMQTLGLENTFMAGYFYSGAYLLDSNYYQGGTPANRRSDVNTDPDKYSQTTPSDIGMLLSDIYLCATAGGGNLIAFFPGQINQTSCQEMILYLQEDKLGALIQAGVPEGTTVAHKHGWDGINNINDAAIVYSPGGNYVLTIYAYHPVQIIWDETETQLGGAQLFPALSLAVYNYFNLPIQ